MRHTLAFLLVLALPLALRADNWKISEAARMEIIRGIVGERVKTAQPLPLGEKHFKLQSPKPVAEGTIVVVSAKEVLASSTEVQITRVEIQDRAIVLDINGGGKTHHHLRNHVQIMAGGMGTAAPGMSNERATGTTVVLELSEADSLAPDALKQKLAPWFRFTSHSATVSWIDTLPPEMKKAITERRAIEGMNQEEVAAAMGKPDKKIRDTDDYAQGETWIYGTPPDPTTFIMFERNVVIKIKKY